jgi:hypothetical protein
VTTTPPWSSGTVFAVDGVVAQKQLLIGTGQTFKPTVVNEFGDIGVAVGVGFIDDAIGAEVEDGVHLLGLLGYCRADPNVSRSPR